MPFALSFWACLYSNTSGIFLLTLILTSMNRFVIALLMFCASGALLWMLLTIEKFLSALCLLCSNAGIWPPCLCQGWFWLRWPIPLTLLLERTLYTELRMHMLLSRTSPAVYLFRCLVDVLDFSQISYVCLIAWFAWPGLIRLRGLPDLPDHDW